MSNLIKISSKYPTKLEQQTFFFDASSEQFRPYLLIQQDNDNATDNSYNFFRDPSRLDLVFNDMSNNLSSYLEDQSRNVLRIKEDKKTNAEQISFFKSNIEYLYKPYLLAHNRSNKYSLIPMTQKDLETAVREWLESYEGGGTNWDFSYNLWNTKPSSFWGDISDWNVGECTSGDQLFSSKNYFNALSDICFNVYQLLSQLSKLFLR